MLALGSIARTVTNLAFDLAGEITVTHVYHTATSVAYSAATGTPTPTEQTATVSAIVGTYTHKETDGQHIRFGDEKLTVKASELGAIVPSPDDYLVAGSVRRNVVSIQRDPTGTIYILQTRKAQA